MPSTRDRLIDIVQRHDPRGARTMRDPSVPDEIVLLCARRLDPQAVRALTIASFEAPTSEFDKEVARLKRLQRGVL